MTKGTQGVVEGDGIVTTDWQLEQLFDAVHWAGEFGRTFRERAREILASSNVQPKGLTITPLEEQQMFDDWCPYKGNPDPRVVWAAAIEAVNGMQLQVAAQAPAVQAGKEQAELEQEIAGLQALVIRQGDRLTEIVNIIRGQPHEGCAHSTHDAVDLVRGLQLHIEQYAMAVQHAERAHGIGKSNPPVQENDK